MIRPSGINDAGYSRYRRIAREPAIGFDEPTGKGIATGKEVASKVEELSAEAGNCSVRCPQRICRKQPKNNDRYAEDILLRQASGGRVGHYSNGEELLRPLSQPRIC